MITILSGLNNCFGEHHYAGVGLLLLDCRVLKRIVFVDKFHSLVLSVLLIVLLRFLYDHRRAGVEHAEVVDCGRVAEIVGPHHRLLATYLLTSYQISFIVLVILVISLIRLLC